MNVYVIKPTILVAGICLIAADNSSIAKLIFNEAFGYATANPIKDWKCTIDNVEELNANVTTSKLLFSFIC